MNIIKIRDDNNIKILGRTVSDTYPVILVWTGSGLELDIKANELWLNVEAPYENFENWIAIEINGEILQRRPLDKEKQWIQIYRGMNPDIVTHVRILKETQANSADPEAAIFCYDLKTDGYTLPLKDKIKIEFIGDSINSGEGAIGAKQDMDWISQIFSHVNSYPYFVGKELDADIHVFSQSGWGVFTSWDNDRSHAVPLYYEEICSLIGKGSILNKGFDKKWDFNYWKPDYIVINLGTNDENSFNYQDTSDYDKMRYDGDSFNLEDVNKIEESAINFIKKVRSLNKDSYIIWAFGIFNCKMNSILENVVNRYKKEFNDNKISYLCLVNFNSETVGSREHPGRISHIENAKIIVDEINKISGKKQ